jgi:hypothetical protein
MLTYQARPRAFQFTKAFKPSFPAKGEVNFHFQPQQPFGLTAGGGRTAIWAVEATMRFNKHTGRHSIESKTPLTPLQVAIEEPGRVVRLTGTTLQIVQTFADLTQLQGSILGVYFALPAILNIPFADPPYVEKVEGKIGDADFRWELGDWQAKFRTTTQDQQEALFGTAWRRMGVALQPTRRRLIAALHYFHVACRLARESKIPGEFVAEVLLNLAKSLEILFPPSGDGKARDAVRRGLKGLDFSDEEIEGHFLPAMALRNEIDVGHPMLEIFPAEQAKVLLRFVERVEDAFREMFDRVLISVEQGKMEIQPHSVGPPSREATLVIQRMAGFEERCGIPVSKKPANGVC